MELIIYTDGAARGNPGHAGAGAVIRDKDGKLLKEVSEYLEIATNNQAEYKALIFALESAKGLGGTKISVYMDSELIVKQLKGEYRVKNEGLLPLYRETVNLLKNFSHFTVSHVPREKNKAADLLANKAIDDRM